MSENSCTVHELNEEMWRIRTNFRSRYAVYGALHYTDIHETHLY